MFLHLSVILFTVFTVHGKEEHAWWRGGVYTEGGAWERGYAWHKCACVAKGGMHGKGRHAWQGVCVQERRPLKRVVHILLECILLVHSEKTLNLTRFHLLWIQLADVNEVEHVSILFWATIQDHVILSVWSLKWIVFRGIAPWIVTKSSREPSKSSRVSIRSVFC